MDKEQGPGVQPPADEPTAPDQPRAQNTKGFIPAVIIVGVIYILFQVPWSSRTKGPTDIDYKSAAEILISQQLRDPGSAEFSNVRIVRRSGGTAIVCGLVNSRNGFGGMSGPVRFISGDRVVVEGQIPASQMDSEWARNC